MEKQIVGRDVSSRWSLTVPVEGASKLLEFRLKLNVHLNEWVSVIASVDVCELKSAAAAAESLQSCLTLWDPMALGTPLGLAHWKRASSPVEAGTAGYL